MRNNDRILRLSCSLGTDLVLTCQFRELYSRIQAYCYKETVECMLRTRCCNDQFPCCTNLMIFGIPGFSGQGCSQLRSLRYEGSHVVGLGLELACLRSAMPSHGKCSLRQTM